MVPTQPWFRALISGQVPPVPISRNPGPPRETSALEPQLPPQSHGHGHGHGPGAVGQPQCQAQAEEGQGAYPADHTLALTGETRQSTRVTDPSSVFPATWHTSKAKGL